MVGFKLDEGGRRAKRRAIERSGCNALALHLGKARWSGDDASPLMSPRQGETTQRKDATMFNETNTTETFTNASGGHNHNFLADCAATITERFQRAKAASKMSLDDLRMVGQRLIDAKEMLTEKGAFGKWCEQFPFDKTWRARLMKLAANWDAIMEAVETVEGEDRKTWSVDGVLGIWAKAEKARNAPEGGEGEGDGWGEAQPKAKKETEAERLRRELAEALARIAALEEALAKAAGGAKEGPKAKAKAKAEEAPKGSAAFTVDAATKTRARKVWALYTKGATDGEKAAAKSRLDEMAKKFNATFEEFVAACGL